HSTIRGQQRWFAWRYLGVERIRVDVAQQLRTFGAICLRTHLRSGPKRNVDVWRNQRQHVLRGYVEMEWNNVGSVRSAGAVAAWTSFHGLRRHAWHHRALWRLLLRHN